MMPAVASSLSRSSNPGIALTGLIVLVVGHMSLQGPFWSNLNPLS